jgi:predicted RNase H-like nuclease (RuvC/YqgF family)
MAISRQQRRLEAQKAILSHFEKKLPAFTDIFDERTFYIAFACLVVACIITAIVLAYCCKVVITDADEIERLREKRKRLKQLKLAEKLLRKRIEKLQKTCSDTKKEEQELDKLVKKIEQMEKKQDSDAEDLLDDKDE